MSLLKKVITIVFIFSTFLQPIGLAMPTKALASSKADQISDQDLSTESVDTEQLMADWPISQLWASSQNSVVESTFVQETLPTTRVTPGDLPNQTKLMNGSFESPGLGASFVNESDVPYWNIQTDKGSPSDNEKIEFWSTTFWVSGGWTSAPGVPFNYSFPDGKKIVEVNADDTGTLYQDIRTAPGEELTWSFEHAQRGPTTEKMNVYIGAPTGSENPTDGLAKQTDDISGATDMPTSTATTSTNHPWVHHTGTYTVPEDPNNPGQPPPGQPAQTVTRLAFRSATAGTGGNLIDDVNFSATPVAKPHSDDPVIIIVNENDDHTFDIPATGLVDAIDPDDKIPGWNEPTTTVTYAPSNPPDLSKPGEIQEVDVIVTDDEGATTTVSVEIIIKLQPVGEMKPNQSFHVLDPERPTIPNPIADSAVVNFYYDDETLKDPDNILPDTTSGVVDVKFAPDSEKYPAPDPTIPGPTHVYVQITDDEGQFRVYKVPVTFTDEPVATAITTEIASGASGSILTPESLVGSFNDPDNPDVAGVVEVPSKVEFCNPDGTTAGVGQPNISVPGETVEYYLKVTDDDGEWTVVKGELKVADPVAPKVTKTIKGSGSPSDKLMLDTKDQQFTWEVTAELGNTPAQWTNAKISDDLDKNLEIVQKPTGGPDITLVEIVDGSEVPISADELSILGTLTVTGNHVEFTFNKSGGSYLYLLNRTFKLKIKSKLKTGMTDDELAPYYATGIKNEGKLYTGNEAIGEPVDTTGKIPAVFPPKVDPSIKKDVNGQQATTIHSANEIIPWHVTVDFGNTTSAWTDATIEDQVNDALLITGYRIEDSEGRFLSPAGSEETPIANNHFSYDVGKKEDPMNPDEPDSYAYLAGKHYKVTIFTKINPDATASELAAFAADGIPNTATLKTGEGQGDTLTTGTPRAYPPNSEPMIRKDVRLPSDASLPGLNRSVTLDTIDQTFYWRILVSFGSDAANFAPNSVVISDELNAATELVGGPDAITVTELSSGLQSEQNATDVASVLQTGNNLEIKPNMVDGGYQYLTNQTYIFKVPVKIKSNAFLPPLYEQPITNHASLDYQYVGDDSATVEIPKDPVVWLPRKTPVATVSKDVEGKQTHTLTSNSDIFNWNITASFGASANTWETAQIVDEISPLLEVPNINDVKVYDISDPENVHEVVTDTDGDGNATNYATKTLEGNTLKVTLPRDLYSYSYLRGRTFKIVVPTRIKSDASQAALADAIANGGIPNTAKLVYTVSPTIDQNTNKEVTSQPAPNEPKVIPKTVSSTASKGVYKDGDTADAENAKKTITLDTREETFSWHVKVKFGNDTGSWTSAKITDDVSPLFEVTDILVNDVTGDGTDAISVDNNFQGTTSTATMIDGVEYTQLDVMNYNLAKNSGSYSYLAGRTFDIEIQAKISKTATYAELQAARDSGGVPNQAQLKVQESTEEVIVTDIVKVVPPANDGKIGDTVFIDENNNGTMDSSEKTAPAGTIVKLYKKDPTGIAVPGDEELVVAGVHYDTVKKTTTNANGEYTFGNLDEGDYLVWIAPTEGFIFSPVAIDAVKQSNKFDQTKVVNEGGYSLVTLSKPNDMEKFDQDAGVIATHKLKYDENGATGGTEPVDETHGTATTVTPVNNPGTLMKTGYTFAGWTESADGTGTVYGSGNTFVMPNEDVTLYAKWTKNKYEVKYDGNGGTGSAPAVPTDYDYETEVTVLGNVGVPEYTKTGYTFAGWTIAGDTTNKVYTAGDKFKMPAEDVLLEAKWTKNKYEVKYDGNGGTGNAPAVPTDYDYETEVTVLGNVGVPEYTKTGYTFAGWTIAGDTTNKVYAAGDKFKMPAEDVLLEAKWTKNKYEVKYDGNGGTGNAPAVPTDYDYETEVTVLGNVGIPEFTKSGYMFEGWTNNADGTGTVYGSGDTFSMPNNNVTLYAKWVPLTGSTNITATKSVTDASGNQKVENGEKLSYTIIVKNEGSIEAKDVSVKDPLTEAGLNASSVANLSVDGVPNSGDITTAINVNVPAMDEVEIKFDVNALSSLSGISQIKNIVTITDPADQQHPIYPEATINVDQTVDNNDITAEKTVEDATNNNMAEPGEKLVYSIVVKNSSAVVKNVQVKDELADATGLDATTATGLVVDNVATAGDITTGIVVSVPANGEVEIKFEVNVNNPLPANVTSITNTATVTDQSNPDHPAMPSVIISVDHEINHNDITARKSVTDESGNNMAESGEQLNYSITVNNSGERAKDILVKDDLIEAVGVDVSTVTGVQINGVANNGDIKTGITVNVPANGEVRITFAVSVLNSLPTDIKLITNVATVTDLEDLDHPDKPAVTIEVAEPDNGKPTLSATKTVHDATGDGYVEGGEQLSYSIVIKNTGNGVASNVTVIDAISTMTGLDASTIANLQLDGKPVDGNIQTGLQVVVPAGGEVVITFDVKATPTFPSEMTKITNIAAITDSSIPSEALKPAAEIAVKPNDPVNRNSLVGPEPVLNKGSKPAVQPVGQKTNDNMPKTGDAANGIGILLILMSLSSMGIIGRLRKA